MQKKIKICIYGLSTYQLLMKSKQDFIGGAEVQEVLLGTELSKVGFDVSFIVADHGQKQHEMVNNIHIYKALPFGYKMNSLISLFNAIRVNWKILGQCDSNIYYCRGSGIYVGLVALFCFLNKKKFILGMASDKDLDSKLNGRTFSCQRISYIVALKLAHCVISQTTKQRGLLKTNFKKNNVQINNMYHVPINKTSKMDNLNVLWVGTIKPDLKNPELFLKLAHSIPEANFQMIGGPAYGRSKSDFEFYENIKKQAREISNLDFVGPVPFSEIDNYFENASILINTSSVEGFPNTFIQAWMNYVPVVSLEVDPDEVICKNKLGLHSKSFNQLVVDVRLLLNNPSLRTNYGNNARMYAEKEFDIKKIIKLYMKIINQLLEISDV
jgi:glycosyltransferase involved in cell wall biosynthesis